MPDEREGSALTFVEYDSVIGCNWFVAVIGMLLSGWFGEVETRDAFGRRA